MKKLVLVMVLVLPLVLAGCSCKRMVDGKETESFLNCLKTAHDYICDPPADVKAVGEAAAPLLVATLNALVPGTVAYVNVGNAAKTADDLRLGLCVLTTELNTLIDVLQGSDVQATQEKMLRTKAFATPLNIQALINWQVLKVKKPKI